MKLTVKSQQKPIEYEPENLTKSQRDLYIVQMEMEAPVGRYAGKTLNWIKRDNIAYSWNCIRLKNDAMKVQVNKVKVYVNESGEQWLGIREIEQKTKPSQWL